MDKYLRLAPTIPLSVKVLSMQLIQLFFRRHRTGFHF